MGAPAVTFDPTYVPAALRERPQWVVWRYEERDGKPTKVPVDPQTGRRASSTDAGTWGPYDEAVAAWRAGGHAGVGYVFAADDPFCGVDLDDCIDDAGIVAPAARDIIESLNSYGEISPSGRGVKVFIVGRKPDGAGCRSKAVEGFKETEVYDGQRFFAVTGRHLAGAPLTVEHRQQQLDELCDRLWPKKRSTALPAPAAEPRVDEDDDALIERAGAAKNGEFFKSLWSGDTSKYGGDESRADLALCGMLAFWTCKDASRMDRLFRRSGLHRPKWDEKRGATTYGEKTIGEAIEGCREVYSRGKGAKLGRDAAPDGGEAGDADGLVSLGRRDPESGRLVLSPKRTLPTAGAYVSEFHHHPEARTLHSYGGVLMEWRGNRYREVEDESVRHRLHPWLHGALCYAPTRAGPPELVPFPANPTTVKQALETIRAHAHLPAATDAPCWLDARSDRPPALEILPCATHNLHIPTGLVLPATPALFTFNALDFDYQTEPEIPERWDKFLEQVFGDDLEAVGLLQEWFGYCLVGDTRQQKMLLVVGPRRSGKGTIGRVLARLVGAANVAGPTISSLAGQFGLQPLIGKSLAIVSDARFTGHSIGAVVERLLCISGEDTLSIERKFLGAVSMKLPARFTFLTNELPRLSDVSTALAGRFLVLQLSNSFYGNEDPELFEKLAAELPGILHWAVEGWKRLNARGRFVQPASSEEAILELEDLASPVGAFVRECCTVGRDHRACVDELYQAWRGWCEREGRELISSKTSFGRDLAAAVPGVKRRRGTGMVSFYEGIRLGVEPACPI